MFLAALSNGDPATDSRTHRGGGARARARARAHASGTIAAEGGGGGGGGGRYDARAGRRGDRARRRPEAVTKTRPSPGSARSDPPGLRGRGRGIEIGPNARVGWRRRGDRSRAATRRGGGGLDPETAAGARAVALELAARAGRMSDVSATLEAWGAGRGSAEERAIGAMAAAMVAERSGDRDRALLAFKAARAADGTSEAALRAIASLEPLDLVAEMNALADELRRWTPRGHRANRGSHAGRRGVARSHTRCASESAVVTNLVF